MFILEYSVTFHLIQLPLWVSLIPAFFPSLAPKSSQNSSFGSLVSLS